MILQLENIDIQPRFQGLYHQQIRFSMLTTEAKKAVRACGSGILGRGAWDGNSVIYPPKEEPKEKTSPV